MTDDTAVATSWLRGLAARGVTVEVRNGRLRMRPTTAYKALTDDEILTLRHHRATIREIVNADWSPDDALTAQRVLGPREPPQTTAPASVAAPVCDYCRRACVGPDHHAYSTLHWDDPVEARRRAKALQEQDIHTRNVYRQLGITPPRY